MSEDLSKLKSIKDSTDFQKLVKIVDTFGERDTNYFGSGKHISAYGKFMIVEVVRYYVKHYKNIGNVSTKSTNYKTRRTIIDYVSKLYEDKPDLTYDDLLKAFDMKSSEGLLAYMLLAFHNKNHDLMMRLTYTYGRTPPLDDSRGWLDNKRIDDWCQTYNMVMWKTHDNKYVMTLNEEYEPINKNIQLQDEKLIVLLLVGRLRAFIIDHDLYPYKVFGPMFKDYGLDTKKLMKDMNIHGGGDIRKHFSKRRMVNKDIRDIYMPIMSGGTQRIKPKTISNPNIAIKNSPLVITLNKCMKGGMHEKISRKHIEKSIKGGVDVTTDTKTKEIISDVVESINEDSYSETLTTTNEHKNTNIPNYKYKSKGLNVLQIIDEAYLHYPFYYGGSHGCDVFDYPTMSPSVSQIHNFLSRYPSAKVGYVLNTKTYASGEGKHWIALVFTFRKVYLICSFAGGYESFLDKGKLQNTIKSIWGIDNMLYNKTQIQEDSNSCGVFSTISILALMIKNFDLEKAISYIGKDASSLKSGFNMGDIRRKLLGSR